MEITSNLTMLITLSLTFVTLITYKLVKLVWLRPKWVEKCLRQEGVKGNPYKPFLGDVRELISVTKKSLLTPIGLSDDHLPRIVPYFYDMLQKYGKCCFMWVGPIPWLITADPENIKEVLTRHEDFVKPDHPITRDLVLGIYGLEGEKWDKHRKIINPAFHLDKVKQMGYAISESCRVMTSSWDEIVISKGGSEAVEVDVWPYLKTLTGEVISRAAFGSNYKQGKTVFDLQTEFVKLAVGTPQPSNYIPGWRFVPTKKNRRLREINKELEEHLTRMVDFRKKEMKAGETTKQDLLGLLLESNMTQIKDGQNKSLTTKEVVDECKLFYLAGSETSSALLAWTMVMLAKHFNWQERARAEVIQVFGNDGTPTCDGLSRLNIMTMVTHEVLRLYPPVYLQMRKVHKDTRLGELMVPAGTEVLLPLCVLHQDPNFWGEDAKEFNPERFVEGVSKSTKGKAIYFPFSTGPRVCIGQSLAIIEAKLALATILQRFCFELAPSYVHAPYRIATIKPQHGINLLLRKSCA